MRLKLISISREKLDRDKTITFTTKLNKANNTLEGYSDEGVLCAITPLDKQPDMISLLQIKSIISEKNGKLKPVYEFVPMIINYL